jgi:hypothetical protein
VRVFLSALYADPADHYTLLPHNMDLGGFNTLSVLHVMQVLPVGA